MKTRNIIMSLVLFCTSAVLNSCTKTVANPEDDLIDVELEKSALLNDPCFVNGTIAERDAEGLLFMWEEEKMAKDIYAYFSDKYKYRIFGNITKSETIHQQAVNRLIEAYGLTNPGSDAPGVFLNEQIADRYQKLINLGENSLVDALRAGALIEETDILDLKEWLNETENPYITRVFLNLLKASENHLRAFTIFLRFQDIAYEPLVLNDDYFSAIIGRRVTDEYRQKGYKAGK